MKSNYVKRLSDAKNASKSNRIPCCRCGRTSSLSARRHVYSTYSLLKLPKERESSAMKRFHKHVKRWQFLRRFHNWRLRREIHKAVRDCRKRMAGYTREQRDALTERANKIQFPNGYWICNCCSPSHYMANGEECWLKTIEATSVVNGGKL